MKSSGAFQWFGLTAGLIAVCLSSCSGKTDGAAPQSSASTSDQPRSRDGAQPQPLIEKPDDARGEPAVAVREPAVGLLHAAASETESSAVSASAAVAARSPQESGKKSATAANQQGTTRLWGLVVGTAADGKTQGGCTQLKVTVGRHGASAFRVGFFESEVGGSGANWRAAGWMAAMVAGQIQEFDPATTQVSFDVAGVIDGPSAGALMTVGVLATLRGDQVRQDAAMTGTINPDGGIGAVGGIAHKIAGAADAGKKLVLIPAGIRRQLDRNQGRLVDLIEVGQQLGVEVRPVVDIFQAYEMLTGQQLPRPADIDHPKLSEAAYEILRPKIDEWLTRRRLSAEEYGNLPESQRYEFPDGRIADSNRLAEAAGRLLIEGQAAGAARSALEASVEAVMGLEVAKVDAVAEQRGFADAKTQAKTSSGARVKLDLLLDQLQTIQPATIAEAGWLIDAFGSLVEGYAFCTLADRLLEAPAENDDKAHENVLAAASYYQLALLDIQLSHDALELGKAHEGPAYPQDAPVQATADFFQHAADANLNVLNASIIDQVAESLDIRPEALQAGLMDNDIRYALVRTIVDRVTPALVAKLEGKPAAHFTRLAAAMYSYSGAAALIAKYGSLDVELKDFEVVAVPKEKTLQNMLDTAEEQARRSIHRLSAVGVDPSCAVMGYELARLQRDRDAAERLTALDTYWNLYIQAQMMAKLAGLQVGG